MLGAGGVMELRWIRTFVVVAEERSFRRAADRLLIAQPAVSQHIASLEKSVGVRLLDRDTRGTRLTDVGSAFLESCRQILHTVESAELVARNAGSGEFGRVRLGFNAGFASDQLVSLVRILRRRHPHLEIGVDSSRTNHQIMRLIREDVLDAGLIGGPLVGEDLAFRPLTSARLCAVVPVEHPLADQDTIEMDQLRDDVFVLTPPTAGWSMRRLVDDELDRHGFQPREILRADDAITLLTLVGSGIAVGFATDNTVSNTPHNLRLVPLRGATPLPVGLAWKLGRETPALRHVIRAAGESE
jgi:DNA-binding transcriptional LysR family regulator